MPTHNLALVIASAAAAGGMAAASAASMGSQGTADVAATSRTAAADRSAAGPALGCLGQPAVLPVIPSPGSLGLPVPSMVGGLPLLGGYLAGSSGFDPDVLVTFLPGYLMSVIADPGLPDPAAVVATVTDPATPLATLSSIAEASRLPVAGGVIGQSGGLVGPVLTTAGAVAVPVHGRIGVAASPL